MAAKKKDLQCIQYAICYKTHISTDRAKILTDANLLYLNNIYTCNLDTIKRFIPNWLPYKFELTVPMMVLRRVFNFAINLHGYRHITRETKTMSGDNAQTS